MLALFGNGADEGAVVEYRVLAQAGGHLHSAPDVKADPLRGSKFDNAGGRTESSKCEALDKHRSPLQSHVVAFAYEKISRLVFTKKIFTLEILSRSSGVVDAARMMSSLG